MNNQKTNEENTLYFTNVSKNKVVFELNVFNKNTGTTEKLFLNASNERALDLIKSIMNSKYKSASINSMSVQMLENGGKVIKSFYFGKKGEPRNYAVELKSVRFKWNVIDKNTNEKREFTTKLVTFSRREENGEVHWGRDAKQEEMLKKTLENLVQSLEDSNNEIRIGIKFLEKEGKKYSYIGYIGPVKERNIDKQVENNNQQHQQPENQNKEIIEQSSYENDLDEIPF